MGYSVRIYAASNLSIEPFSVREDLKRCYARNGCLFGFGLGSDKTAFYYMPKHEKGVLTDASTEKWFTFDGSWSAGTWQTFINELQDLFGRAGSNTPISLHCSKAIMRADDCRGCVDDIEEVKKILAENPKEFSEDYYHRWFTEIAELIILAAQDGVLVYEWE
jgi:hypothetical protein